VVPPLENPKLLTLDAAMLERERLRTAGKKLVFSTCCTRDISII
jgi:hypothetical protein